MMHGKIIPVDFETYGIESRPDYPPEPVGVALKWDRKWQYLSWGHPHKDNNCTKREATRILKDIFKNHTPLMHNAAFDIKVGYEKLGLPWPKDFHDTLFLAYLHDPREASLSLKPLAEKYLNMLPEEQLDLKDWILNNTTCKDTKKDSWGAHIWEAPATLVGKYAKGDVIRTERLFKFFMKYVKDAGMLEAYEREKRVLHIFEDMSTQGVRINVSRLKRDSVVWRKDNIKREEWIKKRLKAPNLEVTSHVQLGKAMDAANKISHWILTEKGNKSTSRENLKKVCTDKQLLRALELFGTFNTFLNTFVTGWLKIAVPNNGRVFPSFNQVRSPDERGKTSYGTRTGRPSSNHPNFLNVPRDHGDADIPWMRNYIIPDKDGVFLIRDYDQQEMRILGHYEEGSLYSAYKKDPTTDAHELVRLMMETFTHSKWERDPAKVMNFGTIYGMGADGTAELLKCTSDEAREIKKIYASAMPDIKGLIKDIIKWSKKGNPIYTWGGREYYAEPKFRGRDFHYKLINYLIQGSGADCTKEAMIRAHEALQVVDGRLVVQVYDEIVACVPKIYEERGMLILKDAMESIEFDVVMLTDGKLSRKSWGHARASKI